jgi:DNA-binding LytR/AlgR family response regulator
MTIAVCDDCQDELNDVTEYCSLILGDRGVVLKFSDSMELYQYISVGQNKVDLFILDIEMPGLSGINLKNLISENYREALVIFLTSHNEMMEQAFGRNVIAFLNKSGYKERLATEVNKILQQYVKMITVFADRQEVMIEIRSILTLKAADYYCEIRYFDCEGVSSAASVLTRKTLKWWEKELDPNEFVKLSRSMIIGLHNVKEIRNDIIIMNDGSEFRIPKGKIKNFRQIYHQYRRKEARVI